MSQDIPVVLQSDGHEWRYRTEKGEAAGEDLGPRRAAES